MALVNVTISDKPPVPAAQGDIWINQTTNEMQMHNGIKFGPFTVLQPQIDGPIMQTIGGQTLTLTHAITQARTLTFPDVTSTLAALGLAQTFTATQTINASGAGAVAVVVGNPTDSVGRISSPTGQDLMLVVPTNQNFRVWSTTQNADALKVDDATGRLSLPFGIKGASGTLTLPAGPDTLVGRATTDTLTNKTLTAPTITGGAAITGAVSVTTSGLTNSFEIIDTGGSGANLAFLGNGSTPNKKFIRATSGILQFLNDAYTTVLMQLADDGGLEIAAPTGGSKGLGAINAAAGYYANGQLVVSGAGVVYGLAVALTPSATISVDPTAGNDFTLVPGQTCTLNAASSPIAGHCMNLIVTTSGTSSFVITFGTHFKSTGTLTTGTVTAKVFTVSFVSDGTNWNETSRTVAM